MLFTSILHSEVTPPDPRPSSPVRNPSAGPSAAGPSVAVAPSTPTRKRLLHFNSPSSNPATPTRRLDTPTDEVYSLSPVRSQSRSLLESPRRSLRNVCKTPLPCIGCAGPRGRFLPKFGGLVKHKYAWSWAGELCILMDGPYSCGE